MNTTNSPDGTPFQYCILKVSGKLFSSKVEFEVDLGKESNPVIGSDELLIANTQKVTTYYNLVDALNYLSTLGWEIVHVYYREFSGTTYNNPEYLMKRSLR